MIQYFFLKLYELLNLQENKKNIIGGSTTVPQYLKYTLTEDPTLS